MKKSSAVKAKQGQKRYLKNKKRLANKPQLSKQERREKAIRDALTAQIVLNNMAMVQRDLNAQTNV
jgi:hypothetical protein